MRCRLPMVGSSSDAPTPTSAKSSRLENFRRLGLLYRLGLSISCRTATAVNRNIFLAIICVPVDNSISLRQTKRNIGGADEKRRAQRRCRRGNDAQAAALNVAAVSYS